MSLLIGITRIELLPPFLEDQAYVGLGKVSLDSSPRPERTLGFGAVRLIGLLDSSFMRIYAHRA